MDRFDKIATALTLTALIGVLVYSHRPRGNLTGVMLNTSASPRIRDSGPAYLLSALPVMRRNDDYADPASYYVQDGEPYNPQPWGLPNA